MDGNQDVRLVIEIKNKQPLELIDLTKSFIALANQFQSYNSEFGQSKEDREAKLYVKKIETGSVILELVEYASIGVLPFVENVNTVVGFATFIKTSYDYLLGKRKEKPKEFSQADFKDFSQIVNPVASENGSQINVSTTINGNVQLHLHLDSTEANAAQNILEKLSKEAKAPLLTNEVTTKVLLSLFQIRTDIKAKTGNKGIIEDISPKPMNIIFDTEELNEEMLHGDFNPNETIYVVDVIPQHVGGKIEAYKVVKLHETFQKTG